MTVVQVYQHRMFPPDTFEVAANPGSWLVTAEFTTITGTDDLHLGPSEARSLAAALLAAADASEATP